MNVLPQQILSKLTNALQTIKSYNRYSALKVLAFTILVRAKYEIDRSLPVGRKSVAGPPGMRHSCSWSSGEHPFKRLLVTAVEVINRYTKNSEHKHTLENGISHRNRWRKRPMLNAAWCRKNSSTDTKSCADHDSLYLTSIGQRAPYGQALQLPETEVHIFSSARVRKLMTESRVHATTPPRPRSSGDLDK